KEVSLALAVDLVEHGRVMRVVPRQSRQIVEAELVARQRVLAPVGLEKTDEVRRHLAVETTAWSVQVQVFLKSLVLVRVRHRKVTGQQVVQRRDVGRALDRRMPAQRKNAAARPADV